MKRILLIAALGLAGCATGEVYIGKDISEIQLERGHPELVLNLPDGRTAYRFVETSTRTVYDGTLYEVTGEVTSRTRTKECVWIFYTEQGGTTVTAVDMPHFSCTPPL